MPKLSSVCSNVRAFSVISLSNRLLRPAAAFFKMDKGGILYLLAVTAATGCSGEVSTGVIASTAMTGLTGVGTGSFSWGEGLAAGFSETTVGNGTSSGGGLTNSLLLDKSEALGPSKNALQFKICHNQKYFIINLLYINFILSIIILRRSIIILV